MHSFLDQWMAVVAHADHTAFKDMVQRQTTRLGEINIDF
jgi:hypothetical protein